MGKRTDVGRFRPDAIKKIRDLESLSQNRLAVELGITPESVRNYEHGRSEPAGFVIDRIWHKYIIGKGYDLQLYERPTS